MTQAILFVLQTLLALLQKAQSDPDVQALIAAIRNLISTHNASTPPTPPAV